MHCLTFGEDLRTAGVSASRTLWEIGSAVLQRNQKIEPGIFLHLGGLDVCVGRFVDFIGERPFLKVSYGVLF